MTDHPYLPSYRTPGAGRHGPSGELDGGLEAARALRVVVVLGIAARLFAIYAAANRISIVHRLQGLLDERGQFDIDRRPDGSALVAQGQGADSLVTFATVISLITLALFFLALVSLGRRKKRGEPVAAAVLRNTAVRIACGCYALVTISSVAARSAFNPRPDAWPDERLHAVLQGDMASIGIQIGVVAILLVIALATSREIGKARAAGHIG